MRPLEVVIIAVLSLYVLSFFLKREKRPDWLSWLPIAATGLVIIHAITEGVRWQMMYIAYLLTAVYLMFWIKNRAAKNKKVKPRSVIERVGSIFGGILLLCLLGATFLVANILPVSEPFPPTGKHKIGTTFFHLIDHDRKEVLTEDSNDVRSLWVQAWYPAETTKSFKRVQVFSESEKFMGDYAWHDDRTTDEWEYIGRAKPYYRIGIKGGVHGNISTYLINYSLQSKIESTLKTFIFHGSVFCTKFYSPVSLK